MITEDLVYLEIHRSEKLGDEADNPLDGNSSGTVPGSEQPDNGEAGNVVGVRISSIGIPMMRLATCLSK